MIVGKKVLPETLISQLIAPCGMNCGLCLAYHRKKKPCVGCNGDNTDKPRHCVTCRIKHCDELKTAGEAFCFACGHFPCQRLRRLDTRYRLKYRMSLVENLRNLQEIGIERFMALEKKRWACSECGGVLCVHEANCLYCGHDRS